MSLPLVGKIYTFNVSNKEDQICGLCSNDFLTCCRISSRYTNVINSIIFLILFGICDFGQKLGHLQKGTLQMTNPHLDSFKVENQPVQWELTKKTNKYSIQLNEMHII